MDEPMVQTWDEISVKTDTFLGAQEIPSASLTWSMVELAGGWEREGNDEEVP